MKLLLTGFFLIVGFISYTQTSPLEKYLNEKWKSINTGHGLSISTPFDMNETDLSEQLSEDVKKMINKMTTFTITSGSGLDDIFSLFVAAVNYVPSVTANLQGALTGSKNNIEKDGAENLVCTTEDASEFGLTGGKMACSFSKAHTQFMSETFVYVKENKMWMIMVLYRQADYKDGKELMKRIHGSIKFETQ